MAILDSIQNSIFTASSLGNYIKDSADKYILTTESIKEGIQGFEFDIVEEHTVEVEADITDHYVEDNSYMQDHVAQKPEKITLRGLVGELTYNKQAQAVQNAFDGVMNGGLNSSTFNNILKESELINVATQKLGVCEVLLPPLTRKDFNFFMKTQEIHRQVENLAKIERNLNLFNIFNSTSFAQSNQEKAFEFLTNKLKDRQLFVVITPFKVYDNMLIERIRASRTGSKYISSFEVSLKRIRYAQTKVTKRAVGRTAQQNSAVVNKGVDNGKKVQDASVLYKIIN
jgi:hypothetical protein